MGEGMVICAGGFPESFAGIIAWYVAAVPAAGVPLINAEPANAGTTVNPVGSEDPLHFKGSRPPVAVSGNPTVVMVSTQVWVQPPRRGQPGYPPPPHAKVFGTQGAHVKMPPGKFL